LAQSTQAADEDRVSGVVLEAKQLPLHISRRAKFVEESTESISGVSETTTTTSPA
jgi:hypothetical protein